MYAASEISSRQDTLSQHNNTKQKSEYHKEICHNLGKPFRLSVLFFFFVFFSVHCSVGECQAGSSHLTVLINPAVDVNLICIILRVVKDAMMSASCCGVHSSFMGKLDPSGLDPSHPLVYL